MKILIVDDSRAMRSMISRAVSKLDVADLTIIESSEGGEAFALIEKEHPDLVFADLYMEPVDGIGLLEAISNKNMSVKVGIVTSEKNQQKLQMVKDAGAAFIIHKPFQIEELQEQVKKVIQS